MSETRIETVFTADASAIAKESKLAAQETKKAFGDAGAGIRLGLGGPLGELSNKLGAVAGSGGPLAIISAGIASVVKIAKWAFQEIEDGLDAAIHDAKRLSAEIDASVNRSKHNTDQLKEALQFLESNRGKTLTAAQMVTLGAHQDTLRRYGLGDLLPEGNIDRENRTFSFSAASAEKLRAKTNRQEIANIDAQIRGLKTQIDRNKDRVAQYRKQGDLMKAAAQSGPLSGVMKTLFGDEFGDNAFEASNPEEQKRLEEEIVTITNQILALEQQRKDLEMEGTRSHSRSTAAETDQQEAAARAAAEQQRKADEEAARERERLQKETDEAARRSARERISELELSAKNIKFLGTGGGQIFTNSLTQRGGFAGGARMTDGNRFQSSILAHNQKQMIELQNIKTEIANLKTI